MNSEFELLGKSYAVIPFYRGKKIQFEIDGQIYSSEFIGKGESHKPALQTISINGKQHRIWLAYDGDQIFIHVGGRHWTVTPVDPLEKAAAAASSGVNKVAAPMPGIVITMHVSEGDSVKKNELLMVIESMKLETSITAPRDGMIQQVHFEEGAAFDKGAALVTFQGD